MKVPVSIRALRKNFGSFEALKDINLDIAPGEFVTLLGPSGSGKTTLLQVLAGFVTPTSGSIMIGGEELLTKPPHQRGIGLVFQNYALFPHMNVFENVAYPLKIRRLSRSEIESRVCAALDMVRLSQFTDRAVDRLSGGQRQRVALARAIVFEPRILLMDESLSALDKKLREQMQIELRHLHERLHTTTVFVTHDQREALTMSDRIAVINNGALIQFDTPCTIYDRPKTRFVADFVGETTFLPVQIDKGGEASVFGNRLRLADHAQRPAPAKESWLALRPEKLAIGPASGPEAEVNRFAAIARETIFQGDSLLVIAGFPDGQSIGLRIVPQEANRGLVPVPGQPIHIDVHRNDSILVGGDV
ncbi:ABC transporter ATP-binding protein [Bosea sp. 2KB_26]|uniref:ABC transporter ATP-binding protein n=1 Tax=Bosea sp. 2KB_26 TaxID=3237475 RepID=UPI003F90846E